MARKAKNDDRMFQKFFKSEVSGSIVLMACTVVALVWANSEWAESYFHLAHEYIALSWGDAKFKLSLQHWINDALMVVFFFVVGLEVKREIVVGRLSTLETAILPVSAAVGGMIVPATIYGLMNAGGPGAAGWGIPMATDIAFALGILAIFGSRVPIGLKVFLTALAIADDIGAVLVIALFYTETIRLGALIVAGVFLFLIVSAVRFGIRRRGIYLLLALGVWVAVFASGIHATVAGILVALMIPVKPRVDPPQVAEDVSRIAERLRDPALTTASVLHDHDALEAIEDLHTCAIRARPAGLSLEHYLHPVQAFLILPLFALFNAGVAVELDSLGDLLEPVTLGIVAGLVIGKQIGVTLFSWLAIRSGRAVMPEGVTWAQLWGVSCLAGVGFTMSLFVSDLAFRQAELVSEAKIGIIIASVLAGIFGMIVLSRALPRAE
jgi:NhaA family Na+:H+ antiporter